MCTSIYSILWQNMIWFNISQFDIIYCWHALDKTIPEYWKLCKSNCLIENACISCKNNGNTYIAEQITWLNTNTYLSCSIILGPWQVAIVENKYIIASMCVHSFHCRSVRKTGADDLNAALVESLGTMARNSEHNVVGIILPIDELIFFRGVGLNHQPAMCSTRHRV